MRRPPSQRPHSSPPTTPIPPTSTPPPVKNSAVGGGAASDGLVSEDMRGTNPEKGGRGSSGGCGGDTVLTVGQAISTRLRRLLSQPSSTSSASNNPHHHPHHHGHRADHQHHHTATVMPRGNRPDGIADPSAAAPMQQQQCPPEHVPGSGGDVQAPSQQQPHYHRKRKERHESLSLSQDRKVIRSSSEERAVVELEVEVAVSEIEVDGRGLVKTTESNNGITRDIVSTDIREQKKTKGSSNGSNNNILRRVSSHEDVTTARHNCNNQLHNHIQQRIDKGPIVIIGKDKDKEKGIGSVKGNGKTFLQELIGGDAPLLAPRSFPQPLHEHNSSPSSNSTSTINPSPKEEDLPISHHSPSSTRVGSPSPSNNAPSSQGTAVATVSPAISAPFFFLPTPVGEEEEEHERRRSSERFASFPRASTPRGGKIGGGSRPRESRRPRRQRSAKVWKEADGDAGGGSSSSKENEEEDSTHEENVTLRDFDKETKSHQSHHYPKYSPQLHTTHSDLSVSAAIPLQQEEKNVVSNTPHSPMPLHPCPPDISANLSSSQERGAKCGDVYIRKGEDEAVEDIEGQEDQEKGSEVGCEKVSEPSVLSPTSSSSSSSTSSTTSTSTSPDDRVPAPVPNLPSPSSVSVPQLDLASLLRRMDTAEEPLTSRGPWLGGARIHGNEEDFVSREMRYFDVSRRSGEREEEEEGHVVPLSPRNSMVLTRGGGSGRCGAYLDPNVPPSPPTEHHLPHLKRLPDPLASESPATILTKQVSRQINSLKKKIKRYEEDFENQFGYRPSHADKLANRDVKKWIAELGKLRKDLKQMKEDPHSPMLASAKTLGLPFPHSGRDASREGKSAKMEDTLLDVEKRLTEKRLASGRPEELEALTREQLQEEKLALQKALLHLESLHGRPSSREERDLVRPLYDRYRMLKRMVIRSGPSKLKDSVTELATIHEHEAMDFTPQVQSEDGVDESRVPALKGENTVGLVPSLVSGIVPDVDKEEDRKVPDIGENLHALPLGDLLGAQREAREEKKRLRRALREFEEEFALSSGRRATKDERPPALEQTAILYKRTRAKLRLLEALVAKHTGGGVVSASPLDE